MANRKSRYNRQDEPPPVGRVLHILKIGDKTRMTVKVCASNIFGVVTHYDRRWKRTVRCTKHLGQCEYHENQVAERWAGFVHVCNMDGHGEAFVELTALAAHRLKAIAQQHGVFRGLIIHLYRERGTIKSPVAVEYVGVHDGKFELPSERSPEPTLDRLWTLLPLNPSKPQV